MKTFAIEFDEQRLKLVCSLIAIAGSKLGDTGVMMSAAEILTWMQQQIDAKAKVEPEA